MNIYEAFFLDKEFDGTLNRQIKNQHITTAFKPDVAHNELYGKKATFAIVAYGNDGNNEGYKVELLHCDKELEKLYLNIPVPHITISVGNEGKPINTGKLNFNLIFTGDQIDTVTATFGAYDMEAHKVVLN